MQQITQERPAAVVQPKERRWFGLDRFTLGIGLAVAVLVPLLFMLVLSQPKAVPADESTPAGVVHNYYLAVQQDDIRKAYGYLSADTRGWLTYEQFSAQVSAPRTLGVRVQDERIEDGTARVAVVVTTYLPGGPFSAGEYSTQRTIVLRRDAEVWRISLPQPPSGPYGPYVPDVL
jgi:hypothetical protein